MSSVARNPVPQSLIFFSASRARELLKDLRSEEKYACTMGKEEDKARMGERGLKGQSEEMARARKRPGAGKGKHQRANRW